MILSYGQPKNSVLPRQNVRAKQLRFAFDDIGYTSALKRASVILGQFTRGEWPDDLESEAYRAGIINTLKFILQINETLPYFSKGKHN